MTQATWLGGIALIGTFVPVIMVIFSEYSKYALIIMACGLLGAAYAAYVAVRSTKNTSPLVKHRFEMIEFVCYVAVFVVLALVLNVYEMARFA